MELVDVEACYNKTNLNVWEIVPARPFAIMGFVVAILDTMNDMGHVGIGKNYRAQWSKSLNGGSGEK